MIPIPDVDWVEELLRLSGALVAGGVLGINRNLRGKAAGLRTHALVSLGAALVVLASLRMTGGDITRVLQGVITGVGFLGAGVILHPQHGHDRVRGLTTAASVWVAAGLGMAAGAGLWSLVALATVGTLAVLEGGGPVEEAMRKRFLRERRARVTPTASVPAQSPPPAIPPSPPPTPGPAAVREPASPPAPPSPPPPRRRA